MAAFTRVGYNPLSPGTEFLRSYEEVVQRCPHEVVLTKPMTDEMEDWLDSDEAKGTYTFTGPNLNLSLFRFSDEKTALVFKLRFG